MAGRKAGADVIGKVASNSYKDRPQKLRKTANPLQTGILAFLAADPSLPVVEEGDIPKRYTKYGSLLLLGPTFPVHTVQWTQMFSSLAGSDRVDLFRRILEAFKDSKLTHIAINAPIAPTTNSSHPKENIMRRPGGLQPVYGDFGPEVEEDHGQHPNQVDFDNAYWTRTIQISNIVQVWAPKWTMFSRGNISEKARILQSELSKSPFPGLTESELGQETKVVDVVDFYVGIGYFAFCYLKRGVARVWGWDINGWSVEGLSRGCIENSWGVRAIKVDEDGTLSNGYTIETLIRDIRSLEGTPEAIRCVVFWGDNRWAGTILHNVQSHVKASGCDGLLNVRHCNLGLLPTSEHSWEGAVQVIDRARGGWLHVHENVAASDITAKQQDILSKIQLLLDQKAASTLAAECCHIEQVKTYAPGVVHCVYDIKIYPSR